MVTINGKYHYQVEDLLEDLKQMPKKALVYAIFHDEWNKFNVRCIYKTSEAADPDGRNVTVSFSLGDNEYKKTASFKEELIQSIGGRIKYYKKNNEPYTASALEILLRDMENNELLNFMKKDG